jgi:hypothetical protein
MRRCPLRTQAHARRRTHAGARTQTHAHARACARLRALTHTNTHTRTHTRTHTPTHTQVSLVEDIVDPKDRGPLLYWLVNERRPARLRARTRALRLAHEK